MHKLTTGMALLTIVGALATPAIAAPNGNRPSDFCELAQNANNQFCVDNKGRDQHLRQSGASNDKGTSTDDGQNGNGGKWNGNGQHDGNWSGKEHSQDAGDQPQNGGMGNWSRHDRDEFHQRFHNFNFGFFAAPSFGIYLGVRVPHSYDLRPVPRSITRYYPQFRGYLFFATRHGDIVIVSPESHRITAVL